MVNLLQSNKVITSYYMVSSNLVFTFIANINLYSSKYLFKCNLSVNMLFWTCPSNLFSVYWETVFAFPCVVKQAKYRMS